MSALAGVWDSELAKLREKVGLRKLLNKSGSKLGGQERGEEAAASGGVVVGGEKPLLVKSKERRDSLQAESGMSEATVCLLMDRFVPC